MTLKDYKNSKEFDDIFKECIKRKRLSVSSIQKRWKLGIRKATMIYEEYKNYNDEVFLHNAYYEISFLEEAQTVARIMSLLNVSYVFAQKLLEDYLEMTSGMW